MNAATRRVLSVAAATLCLGWLGTLAVLSIHGSPEYALPSAILAGLARGWTAAFAWATACVALGRWALRRLAPALLDGDLRTLHAAVAGYGLLGLLSLLAALTLGVTACVAWGLLAALLGVAAVRALGAGLRFTLPSAPALASVGLLVVLASTVLLAPPTDTDEIYYHLALPRQMLDLGGLVGGPWNPNGSRPLALHLPYAWLLATGGVGAPRAFHVLALALLLRGVHTRAREAGGPAAGIAAVGLLAGSATILGDLGLAHADLPAALCAFAAWDAARRPDTLRAAGLAAGAALATKYTAAVAVVPVAVVYGVAHLARTPLRRGLLREGAAAAVLAGMLVLPWLLRNVVEGNAALFPYMGWSRPDLVFHHPEKYGAGRDLQAFVLLPWNAVMAAETSSFVFLGRLSPLFLGLLPAAVVAAVGRRARSPAEPDADHLPLLLAAALGVASWATGPHLLRYLVPVLPLLAVALGIGALVLPIPLRLAAVALWLAGLPSNLGPVLSTVQPRIPVSLGQTEPDAWLEQHLPGWAAVRWLNDQAPADARVALLYTWLAWPLQRPWTLGSVEDHVPTRAFLADAGDRVIDELQAAGVTHVLVHRGNFLRKGYRFLPEEAWRDQFEAPEADLERQLTAGATLVFEEGRFSVWALPGGVH